MIGEFILRQKYLAKTCSQVFNLGFRTCTSNLQRIWQRLNCHLLVTTSVDAIPWEILVTTSTTTLTVSTLSCKAVLSNGKEWSLCLLSCYFYVSMLRRLVLTKFPTVCKNEVSIHGELRQYYSPRRYYHVRCILQRVLSSMINWSRLCPVIMVNGSTTCSTSCYSLGRRVWGKRVRKR